MEFDASPASRPAATAAEGHRRRPRAPLEELAWLRDAIVPNQNARPQRALQPLDINDVLTPDVFAVVRALYMPRLLDAQQQRRVRLNAEVTLTFQNRSTVLFRVHELLRSNDRWDSEFIQVTLDDCRRLLPSNGVAATLEVHATGHRRQRITEELRARPFDTLCMFVGNRWFDAQPVGSARPNGDSVSFELPGLAPSTLIDPRFDAELALVIDDELVEVPLRADTRVALGEDLRRSQNHDRRARRDR